MFRELLRHQELMDDMMQRCGVDVLDLINKDIGQSFAEACAKCRFCACVGACRQWLLGPERELSRPPDFCPNTRLFRASLKQEH